MGQEVCSAPAPPQAARMSTPGANMSTQRPVLLQGYSPVCRPRLSEQALQMAAYSHPATTCCCGRADVSQSEICLIDQQGSDVRMELPETVAGRCLWTPVARHGAVMELGRLRGARGMAQVPQVAEGSHLPSLTPAWGRSMNLLARSEAAILSVPFTLPGAMVQLSALVLPAATTTVICVHHTPCTSGLLFLEPSPPPRSIW